MLITFKIITILFIILAVLLWIATIVGWFLTEPGFEPLNVFVYAILSTFISIWSWLHSMHKQRNGPNDEPNQANITQISGSVTTGIMVTGGENVTINSPTNQLNYRFVGAESDEKSIEYFQQLIDVNYPNSEYDREQFNSYKEIWKTLQKLKFAGDNLWQEANERNMSQFFEQLLKTRRKISVNALFFDEIHYTELTSILGKFDAYGLGKSELVQLYAAIGGKGELPKWSAKIKARVSRRVDENHLIKEAYERLLDSILMTFRTKLSNLR